MKQERSKIDFPRFTQQKATNPTEPNTFMLAGK
jgi:hypothetical protein